MELNESEVNQLGKGVSGSLAMAKSLKHHHTTSSPEANEETVREILEFSQQVSQIIGEHKLNQKQTFSSHDFDTDPSTLLHADENAPLEPVPENEGDEGQDQGDLGDDAGLEDHHDDGGIDGFGNHGGFDGFGDGGGD